MAHQPPDLEEGVCGKTSVEIKELRNSNRQLQAALDLRTKELSNARASLDAVVEAAAHDNPTIKIIELAKKNRALLLKVESERQKALELQHILDSDNQSSLTISTAPDPQAVETIARGMVAEASEAVEKAEMEATRWKDRCKMAVNKTARAEQKVFTLEADIKKLQRALQREVGEDVCLSDILEKESSWRGRAQKILALQEKLAQNKNTMGVHTVQRTACELHTQNHLGRMARQKRQDVIRLEEQLKAVQEQLKAERIACERSTLRKQAVEGELKGMKSKMKILLQKAEIDDKLIAALKAQSSVPNCTGKVHEDESTSTGNLQRLCNQKELQIQKQEQIILGLSATLRQRDDPSTDSSRILSNHNRIVSDKGS